MGNVICGDNADTPTPYDFAMGGAGLSCSIPVGCNGSLIRPGMAVMIDMCGNFTGYMTDMTRVYSVGELPDSKRGRIGKLLYGTYPEGRIYRTRCRYRS